MQHLEQLEYLQEQFKQVRKTQTYSRNDWNGYNNREELR